MFTTIHNFTRLTDKLTASGMPTAEQLADAASNGVQVIINLAPHDVENALANEAEIVTSLGMEYISIPVVWHTPTKDGLDKFMDAMDARPGQSILVHCEVNFRASAFIALHRILRQGWKKEDAMSVMHQIWNEDAYPVWKMFIDETLKRKQKSPHRNP